MLLNLFLSFAEMKHYSLFQQVVSDDKCVASKGLMTAIRIQCRRYGEAMGPVPLPPLTTACPPFRFTQNTFLEHHLMVLPNYVKIFVSRISTDIKKKTITLA